MGLESALRVFLRSQNRLDSIVSVILVQGLQLPVLEPFLWRVPGLIGDAAIHLAFCDQVLSPLLARKT